MTKWKILGHILAVVGSAVMGKEQWEEHATKITVEQEGFKLYKTEHKDEGKILVIHASPKEPFINEIVEQESIYAICRTIINGTKLDYIYFDKIGISGERDYIYKFTSDKLMKEAVKRSKKCFKVIVKNAERTLWAHQGEIVD